MVSSGFKRIGITTYLEPTIWGVWQREAAALPRVYLDAVVAAGGTPVLLPPVGVPAPSVLDMLDGLVISGGCDVDPASYGAEPHPETVDTRPGRDTHELALIRAALERDLPLLTICRGLQVLNIALGGTLHQHLPEVVGHERHRPVPGEFGTIEVKTTPGTRTAGLVGEQLSVQCHHHQAIDRLGTGLQVAATADDGTIEAAELPDQTFALGIQWHPEETIEDLRLFQALVNAK